MTPQSPPVSDDKPHRVIKVTNPKAIAKIKKILAEKEDLHRRIRRGDFKRNEP